MNNIRVASVCLVVALVCAPRPAHAQGPNNSLNARVAALEAAVAALQNNLIAEAGVRAAADAALQGRASKLEGNITTADLVGTYTIGGIQTRLGGFPNARIGSAALTGNMALNSDATGSLTINGDGSLLTVLGGTLAPSTLGNGNPGSTFNFTWAYANGALTLTFPGGGGGQGPGINVGPAGRLLVVSVPEFNVAESKADVSLLIFYRLQ